MSDLPSCGVDKTKKDIKAKGDIVPGSFGNDPDGPLWHAPLPQTPGLPPFARREDAQFFQWFVRCCGGISPQMRWFIVELLRWQEADSARSSRLYAERPDSC